MTSTSHIYAISAGNNAVNIGIAGDLKSRLSTLQSGHYEPLKVAFSHTCGKKEARIIEQFAHHPLEAKRLRGEWFNVTPERAQAAIIKAIERVQAKKIPSTPLQENRQAPAITGTMVKAARAMLGWKQGELAKRSGVSLPTIKRIEGSKGTLRGSVKNIETVQSTLDDGGVLLRYEPNSGMIEVRLKK
jgi:DNA-binding XRE family transcriptional regulator